VYHECGIHQKFSCSIALFGLIWYGPVSDTCLSDTFDGYERNVEHIRSWSGTSPWFSGDISLREGVSDTGGYKSCGTARGNIL
jgi:hypothetical protein